MVANTPVLLELSPGEVEVLAEAVTGRLLDLANDQAKLGYFVRDPDPDDGEDYQGLMADLVAKQRVLRGVLQRLTS